MLDVERVRQKVPAELLERRQWVGWKSVYRRGRETKLPIDAKTGEPASTTDPATWASFDDAVAACPRYAALAGIGVVFAEDDPLCGIDLDGCIVDGQVVPEAQAIIDTFNTYTEISPSGNGVKIFLRGRKPAGAGCRKDHVDGFDHIEIYDAKRFFTVTGDRLAGTPSAVEDRQAELHALCRDLWPPKTSGAPIARHVGEPDKPAVVSGADMATREARCQAYLEKCPDAISGHGGHNATLRAACECYRFGLDEAAAWRVMRWFNEHKTGGETWTDKELAHKLDSARKKVDDAGEVGVRLVDLHAEAAEMDSAGIAALMTDVGNAARLVRRYGRTIRYCYGPEQWLIWDGRRWKPDDRGRIVKLCKRTALGILDEAKRLHGDAQKKLIDWAMASQKRERLTAMAALAQPEVAVGPDDLDADPWALNCQSGTIDLRTGELRPHRQDDLITKIAPVEYDAEAACPRFDAFLREIFDNDEDLIRFVQRWHGHCLSADVREQYLPIYHGEGNNGKSVLLDTISAVMGDYAGEAPPDLITVRKHPEHPTEIADLLGKRLVIASETERDAELRLQLIKRLTGNARLKARRMRQDYFEFDRTHKMILVTNNRPAIRENTEAVWRRLRLVPFNVIIPKQQRDPDLMRKLKHEYAGILAWLVRGCVDWLREGLTEPRAVVVATEGFRGSANSLDAFLLECCSLSQGVCVRTSDLIEAYIEWCARNRRTPLRRKALAAALKAKGCYPRKFDGQWHWVNIDLDRLPSGHIGQIGRDVPIDRRIVPREAVNGKVMSNSSNTSGEACAADGESDASCEWDGG